MQDTSKLSKAVLYTQDYPVTGITYRDLSYIYSKPYLLSLAVDTVSSLVRKAIGARYDHAESLNFISPQVKIVAPEARGFILGASVAHTEHLGFVMARKFGKLPDRGVAVTYFTEYSSSTLEINPTLFAEGDEVIIIDDILATGGTMTAINEIIKDCGASLICGIALFGIKECEAEWKKLAFDTYVGFIA